MKKGNFILGQHFSLLQNKTALIIFLYLALFGASCIFVSCSKPQVHVHDRHVLSYDLVAAYARKHTNCTLVLLDYHSDVHPGQRELTSVNWAGRLVEEKLVSKIIWVSGRTLLLPNRNARMKWLGRCLQDAYPETASFIKDRIQLCDYNDLIHLSLKKPYVITLDFDVFTKNPGPDPDAFTDELCTWIQMQKPDLLTLAFSASYETEPSAAWERFARFINNYQKKSNWYFESGAFGEEVESLDDLNKESYNAYGRGAYVWLRAPDQVRDALLSKNAQPVNEEAKTIVAHWKNETLKELRQEFPPETITLYHDTAHTVLNDLLKNQKSPSFYSVPKQTCSITDSKSRGVAVRFKTAETDRGCLSLYGGMTEMTDAVSYCAQEAQHDPRYTNISAGETLFINISLFGPWQQMSSPLDFTPGQDSVLMEDVATGERTLLQGAIALEHNYSREAFLSRLSHKAGLGFDGWKNEGIRFWKAPTLTNTAPL